MWLGILVAVMALLPLSSQLQLEEQRSAVEQLKQESVQYCEIASCGVIEIAGGLEITTELLLEETEFGVNAELRVINHGMASGSREFWFELRSPQGQRIESMRGQLDLSGKGAQYIDFFFTGTKSEMTNGTLILGY